MIFKTQIKNPNENSILNVNMGEVTNLIDDKNSKYFTHKYFKI